MTALEEIVERAMPYFQPVNDGDRAEQEAYFRHRARFEVGLIQQVTTFKPSSQRLRGALDRQVHTALCRVKAR